MNAYVEGYGCSMNKNDSEQIRGFLKSNGFSLSRLEDAELVIINTCAVKLPTEYRMLKRIGELHALSCRKNFTLVVFGCLPKISPAKISSISPAIVQMGPNLKLLADFLGIAAAEFSPLLKEERENQFISIITLSRGCIGNCAFCAVKKARGPLRSYSPSDLEKKFREAVRQTKELWLTAQDTGCYGMDIGTTLPKLLERLLENSGNYRVRLGMMNPSRFGELYEALVPLYNDRHIYKFLHIPLQSGSNRILDAMKRDYSCRDFIRLAEKAREDIEGLTIATDIIVGFPGESELDFRKTVDAIKEVRPEVVNISRYGMRPGTAAEAMEEVAQQVKKERSRILAELCGKISLEQNKKMVGTTQEIFVSENGQKGKFVGRTANYRPVVISPDLRGCFAMVEIKEAFQSYLAGVLQ